MNDTSASTTYYHGGVIGRRCGDLIRPASDMGLDYTAEYAAKPGLAGIIQYDPRFVYMTTHLGAARGYAARYKNLGGVHRPGDVYIVEPCSELHSDPEYDNPNNPGNFVMTPGHAVVIEVVERRVVLSRREQNREQWPSQCFNTWVPVHASDGTVQVSEEMRSYGVTEEYVRLLPKWMDFAEFGRAGGIWKPGVPGVDATADEVLDILAHLQIDASEHAIANDTDRTGKGTLHCIACGLVFGSPRRKLAKADRADRLAAALHQTGSDLRTIAAFNGGLAPFIHALIRRHPARWRWLTD